MSPLVSGARAGARAARSRTKTGLAPRVGTRRTAGAACGRCDDAWGVAVCCSGRPLPPRERARLATEERCRNASWSSAVQLGPDLPELVQAGAEGRMLPLIGKRPFVAGGRRDAGKASLGGGAGRTSRQSGLLGRRACSSRALTRRVGPMWGSTSCLSRRNLCTLTDTSPEHALAGTEQALRPDRGKPTPGEARRTPYRSHVPVLQCRVASDRKWAARCLAGLA